MLRALTGLVLCQFGGEVVARGVGIPLPGPVLGLVLLLVILIVRGGPGEGMLEASNGLLRHLSLLFVPAGVGIVTQLDALAQDWVAIVAAVLASTVLAVAVTGWVAQRLFRDTES